jgi:hypothetical protein
VSVTVRPGAHEITDVVGPAAPYVTPPVVVEAPVRPSTGQRPGRGPKGGPKPSGSAAGRRGNPNAPARTRAELAARAGQQPPARRRSR